MKFNVLVDKSGNIVAAHFISPTLPVPPGPRPMLTMIQPSEGQSLHQVDVPAELETHVQEGTLPKEISKWKLERHGKTSRLVKG